MIGVISRWALIFVVEAKQKAEGRREEDFSLLIFVNITTFIYVRLLIKLNIYTKNTSYAGISLFCSAMRFIKEYPMGYYRALTDFFKLRS
jgi:hypothetical protein